MLARVRAGSRLNVAQYFCLRTCAGSGISAQRSGQQRRALIQPSFDYKHIRDNAQVLLQNAQDRNVLDARPHRVGELYDEFRKLTTLVNEKRSELNSLSKELGSLARNLSNKHRGNMRNVEEPTVSNSGMDQSGLQAAMNDLKEKAGIAKATIQAIDAQLKAVETRLQYEASKLPNISHPDTPVGDESQARTLKTVGTLHTKDKIPLDPSDGTGLSEFDFKDHYDLALDLGIVDMEAGAKVAGSRFHYWRGAGALLELALVQYAMTRATAAGFTPHITPDMARSSIVDACGFRPRSGAEEHARFGAHMGGKDQVDPARSRSSGEASQIYRVSAVAEEDTSGADNNVEADPLCLIATAEIPLVAMRAQQILDRRQLPMSAAGLSHCFRAEAGARGRDTRGIYRLHQFTKVELVTLALPESSQKELDRLVDFQAALYSDLGLTFRVLQMPTHELGASAYQKYDIEAWMPGRKAWGEISSASNCTDYQARRLGIRVRASAAKDGSSAPVFVHTLNATAVAVPRIVVALLESHQRPDGSVVVPQALRPWMMGMDVLVPSSH
ncbi:seryl-tRNA synthetase [Coemansia sp. RSA 486]|nr:seryl-tRNA synthetase [Coemansia sp. RSA 486]